MDVAAIALIVVLLVAMACGLWVWPVLSPCFWIPD